MNSKQSLSDCFTINSQLFLMQLGTLKKKKIFLFLLIPSEFYQIIVLLLF